MNTHSKISSTRPAARCFAALLFLALVATGMAFASHAAGAISPTASTASSTSATASSLSARQRVAVYATYHATDDLSKRYSPTAARGPSGGPRRGEALSVECQIEGEPAGPHSNKLYFWITYHDEHIYVPDAWTDSPHLAVQPPSAGIPICGGTEVTGGSVYTEVWFGSPVEGAFPTSASSQPQNHKISYGGDWAMDEKAAAGQQAMVYVAPQDGQSSITTKIDSVRPACASHVINDGGYVVVVGVYNGSARVGYIAYAHLNPSVSVGQTVDRWGGVIGTVGSYRNDPVGCWSGSHVHIEGYNTKNFSCFNGTYGAGQVMHRSNFVGFLGGTRATHTRQACP